MNQKQNDIGAAVRQVLGDSLAYLYPAAMRTAVTLGIADQLADGPKTADELAAKSGASADHLRRTLRFLATRGMFHEEEDGTFGLTVSAGLLKSDSPLPMASIVNLLTDELYWLPAGKLDDTVRNGTTAFPDIFGAPLFDYLAERPERGEVFHTALDELSATEHGGIVTTYPFPESCTVADIGGGKGGLLREVLTKNPTVNGILFDHESVVADHGLDTPDLKGRWEIEAGSFFEKVPTADVYLLKRILHDWNDADCVRILRSCRDSMAEGGKVVVVDTVVPSGNDPHPSKLSDLAMMIVFDGKERSEAELEALFAEADLKLARVIPTSGSVSIVEAIAA
ncbi:methyltransferase [Actinophytocola oryzae]|uniref:O-methyltransferase n=1 Tax=Actinophytocola oryzae TaxID=502181 RepID=A0A4R7W4Q9_9PSEU|nr:methyltransferase [Actinophytocola oryzae]TDV57584.1 O-methyltransferase [Actinophytocola oryzae]